MKEMKSMKPLLNKVFFLKWIVILTAMCCLILSLFCGFETKKNRMPHSVKTGAYIRFKNEIKTLPATLQSLDFNFLMRKNIWLKLMPISCI